MEKQLNKRKRTANFTAEEKLRFVRLLCEEGQCIISKVTAHDTASNKEKEQAWAKITQIHNSSGDIMRTTENLKKIWGKLKTEAKTFKAANKYSVSGTGGGPSKKFDDPLMELVAAITGRASTGILDIDDCDAVTDEVNMREKEDIAEASPPIEYLDDSIFMEDFPEDKPIREKSAKLARVAREEARPKQSSQNNNITFNNGGCETSSCGKGAACVPYKDNQHYCVCIFNREPAKEGVKCPRSSVSVTFINGGCETSSCGKEATCIPYGTQHYCVCTSNGEPAKEGVKCSGSTISGTYINGGCETSSCGKEATCVSYKGNQHYCVCTSSGELAKAGLCPGSTVTFINGGCETSSCGKEAACVPYKGTQHYCVCTSNGEPAKEGVQCPRSTVPLTQRKAIHNVIPPRPSNAEQQYPLSPPTAQVPRTSSEMFTDATAGTETAISGSGPYSPSPASAPLLIGMAAGCGLLLVLVTIFIICLRKRICNVDRKVKPRVRPGEPLLAERYITNPQYGLCGAGSGPAPPVAPGTPAPPPANKADEPEVTLLEQSALTFLEEVGEGCFGKVYKGILRGNGAEDVVAIKVLKEIAGRSAEQDFMREVNIMSAFRHPNILSLIGVVYKDDTNVSPWMVFEYMKWGDLAGVLRGSRGGSREQPTLDESALLHVALQVARGMQYLASRRFVHRDLAARNCLVGANLAVKIADFGMSRDVYTCDYYKMGGERPMPVRWMPPESIVYARFTHESDVWSYGVVLWEIYSRGKQPFYGCNNYGATKKILRGILLVPPEDCPRFACELMRSCWAIDPRDRIAFDEICRKLEDAQAEGGSGTQIRLPRPPTAPLDSAGYLVPNTPPTADYLKPLPDQEPESDFSDDEDDDEYT